MSFVMCNDAPESSSHSFAEKRFFFLYPYNMSTQCNRVNEYIVHFLSCY